MTKQPTLLNVVKPKSRESISLSANNSTIKFEESPETKYYHKIFENQSNTNLNKNTDNNNDNDNYLNGNKINNHNRNSLSS